MCEGIKGEVEGLRGELSQIRTQQAPWEAKATEVNSRISVASAERDLLLKKQGDAQKRLKVSHSHVCFSSTKYTASGSEAHCNNTAVASALHAETALPCHAILQNPDRE
jgi:chromosome segregation ATPase